MSGTALEEDRSSTSALLLSQRTAQTQKLDQAVRVTELWRKLGDDEVRKVA
jgi:hypothetical protein